MIKRILIVFALVAGLLGLSAGTVLAKGPPPGTHGYDMYELHAGDGTHADDPLDIIEPPPDGGAGTGI